MPYIELIILFILGLCFGSFSSVLIHRWKEKEGGIFLGRSHCPHCHTTLRGYELVPIFSWLIQRGKCRTCHTKIPALYPLLELFFGVLFIIGGYVGYTFGYSPLDLVYVGILFWFFATGIYIVYDILYTEIPDQIMIPAVWSILLLLGGAYFSGNSYLIFDSMTYHTLGDALQDKLHGGLIAYTFFFLQILIPGMLFLARKGAYKKILFLIGYSIIFPFAFLTGRYLRDDTGEDDEEEIPSWVGGGDLRIALFIGLTLGTLHTLVSIFIAYILGSVYGIIHILRYGKVRGQQVPFGPFLGIGWILSMIFYGFIIDFVNTYFLTFA